MSTTIKHIPRKKKALNDKLLKLTQEKASEYETIFLGRCGKSHLVRTNFDKEIHGIAAGQFVTNPKKGNALLLCVGIGEICKIGITGKEVLWFLDIEDSGVSCTGSVTFAEFQNESPQEVLLVA